MRMLALAEGLSARGTRVAIAGEMPPRLAQRLSSVGEYVRLDSYDAETVASAARARQARVVVADGYDFGWEFQRYVREQGFKLLVVDDNGENDRYDADWILNVNPHAQETLYSRRNNDAALLLGTQFVLLRQAFLLAAPVAAATGRARRILVTFGGADPVDATSLVITALQQLPDMEIVAIIGAANPRANAIPSAPGLVVMHDVTNIHEVMTTVDLAVCGPSTTCWELGFLQVPVATLVIAENQVRIGAELERFAATCNLGDARSRPSANHVRSLLSDLVNDPYKRRTLVGNMGRLIDGRGVERVISQLGAS